MLQHVLCCSDGRMLNADYSSLFRERVEQQTASAPVQNDEELFCKHTTTTVHTSIITHPRFFVLPETLCCSKARTQ
jgi:hypothetical protein